MGDAVWVKSQVFTSSAGVVSDVRFAKWSEVEELRQARALEDVDLAVRLYALCRNDVRDAVAIDITRSDVDAAQCACIGAEHAGRRLRCSLFEDLDGRTDRKSTRMNSH